MWDQPFSPNENMTKLEKIMTESCSRIAVKWGHTDFLVDDDKLRFRSFSSSKSFGWTRSKGLKSFGPVYNMLCHMPMGHQVAGTMLMRGEGTCETNKRMLLRIAGCEDVKNLDLHSAMLEGDRGCNDDASLELDKGNG